MSTEKQTTSLHGEEGLMHGLVEMPDSLILDKSIRFAGLKKDPNLMPKHRAAYDRLLAHYSFEAVMRTREETAARLLVDSIESEAA